MEPVSRAMEGNHQLRWVQRNRLCRDRTQQVGERVYQLARELEAGGRARARGLARVITTIVDQEFCRHCRITVAGSNTVLVNVDDAAMVYVMRARWLAPLQRAYAHRGDVSRIAFRLGTEGVPVAGGSTGEA